LQIKGQGIYAFVTLMEGVDYSEELRKELRITVRSEVSGTCGHEVDASSQLNALSNSALWDKRRLISIRRLQEVGSKKA
jgi:hypothetical protein